MNKKKSAKKEPVHQEAEKAPKKGKPEPEPTPEPVEPEPVKAKADTPSDTLADTPSEPPAKPVITYEVMESTGTDDQFEYVRVNVKVVPPFNGFDESIITVPCPLRAQIKGGNKDRELLIREKAAWKVNSHVGNGAHSFNADDVKEA